MKKISTNKMPEYAQQNISGDKIQFQCKSCKCRRWGEVNIFNWRGTWNGIDRLFVTCMKCGIEQDDHYNW